MRSFKLGFCDRVPSVCGTRRGRQGAFLAQVASNKKQRSFHIQFRLSECGCVSHGSPNIFVGIQLKNWSGPQPLQFAVVVSYSIPNSQIESQMNKKVCLCGAVFVTEIGAEQSEVMQRPQHSSPIRSINSPSPAAAFALTQFSPKTFPPKI